MSFFLDPEVTMSNKLMELIYIFIGLMVVIMLICIYNVCNYTG